MYANKSVHPPADWLRALIAVIVDQHHAYLKRQLPSIESLLADAAHPGSGAFCQAAAGLLPVFLRFRREMEAHMKREEVTLFPLIGRMEAAVAEGQPVPRNTFGPLGNAIQFMKEDHDFENQLLGIMSEISQEFAAPAGAPAEYATAMSNLGALAIDLKEHVHKEDEVLFPHAIRIEDAARRQKLRL